jgi:hypothetical protein
VAGRIRSIEKSKDLIGNRTHDLPACSIVPLINTGTVRNLEVISNKFNTDKVDTSVARF